MLQNTAAELTSPMFDRGCPISWKVLGNPSLHKEDVNLYFVEGEAEEIKNMPKHGLLSVQVLQPELRRGKFRSSKMCQNKVFDRFEYHPIILCTKGANF